MLAVVKEVAGPGFVLKDVDIPVPEDDEVLIKVEAVGICGSDIPIFKGIRPVPLPFIPGHEFAGTIVDVGADVREFKKGDKVVPGLVQNCGRCKYCRQGLESLCDNLVETGIHVNGAFAEYVAVPEHTLHLKPEEMTFSEGASVDPIASAYRPVKKACVGSEDVVVVYGPGPIGLYAAQIARVEGAKTLIMVGTRESRLQLARELGVDITINIGEKKEDPIVRIKELTGGEMADVVIETAGTPEVIEMCLNSVRKNGRLSLAGVLHKPSTLLLAPIVRREINITGSICYTWLDFQNSMDLVASGKVKVGPIVTHELPLKDIAKGLDLIDKREAIKVVLHP